MDAIGNTVITDRFKLPDDEVKYIMEIRSIYMTSIDRLASLEQKIQDCQRLLDGRYTHWKWERGWGEAAIVAFDADTSELVCMEVRRGKNQKEI